MADGVTGLVAQIVLPVYGLVVQIVDTEYGRVVQIMFIVFE